MSSDEQEPFDPHAFAASIVPPKNPYAGYYARQAELNQKDHPWANPEDSAEPLDDQTMQDEVQLDSKVIAERIREEYRKRQDKSAE